MWLTAACAASASHAQVPALPLILRHLVVLHAGQRVWTLIRLCWEHTLSRQASACCHQSRPAWARLQGTCLLSCTMMTLTTARPGARWAMHTPCCPAGRQHLRHGLGLVHRLHRLPPALRELAAQPNERDGRLVGAVVGGEVEVQGVHAVELGSAATNKIRGGREPCSTCGRPGLMPRLWVPVGLRLSSSTTMSAVVSHGRQTCSRSQLVCPQPGRVQAATNSALVHRPHCVGYSTVPSAFSSSSHSCTAGRSETMEKSRSSRLM